MSIMNRLVTMLTSIVILFAFPLTINAEEANTTFNELENVFVQAQTDCENAPISTFAMPQVPSVQENVLPDGTVLMVIGYPTSYSCDNVPLENDESSTSYIYALRSSELDESGMKKTKTWGYLSSTIKYYTDGSKYRIDSFSYQVGLNSGYSMSNIEVTYYSYDSTVSPKVSADYTFNTTSLKMTNYPTSRLGWVSSSVSGDFVHGTGVKYFPTINGVKYGFAHTIVPFGQLSL